MHYYSDKKAELGCHTALARHEMAFHSFRVNSVNYTLLSAFVKTFTCIKEKHKYMYKGLAALSVNTGNC